MVRSDTAQAVALALSVGMCHKGGVKRLRDFESIAAFLSGREIDELQAAVDTRREARARSSLSARAGRRPGRDAAPGQAPRKGRHAG